MPTMRRSKTSACLSDDSEPTVRYTNGLPRPGNANTNNFAAELRSKGFHPRNFEEESDAQAEDLDLGYMVSLVDSMDVVDDDDELIASYNDMYSSAFRGRSGAFDETAGEEDLSNNSSSSYSSHSCPPEAPVYHHNIPLRKKYTPIYISSKRLQIAHHWALEHRCPIEIVISSSSTLSPSPNFVMVHAPLRRYSQFAQH
jgi:hypothetical protein